MTPETFRTKQKEMIKKCWLSETHQATKTRLNITWWKFWQLVKEMREEGYYLEDKRKL